MKALTEKEYEQIRDELDHCQNPLYLFHDDPDGLCSFLLFYKYKLEGNGIIVKATPIIDAKYLKKVEEYNPDKIFILDIADVTQEFIDSVRVPIIWVDHHGPYERNRIKYFNPRNHDIKNNPPVSYMNYFVVEENEWISLAGMVSDWFLPGKRETDGLSKRHPKLLPKGVYKPEEALFTTEVGKLARIMSFILKGSHSDAKKYVKVMTRIKTAEEILEQTTPKGKYIYKKYDKINKDYQAILSEAKKKVTKSKFLVFEYNEDRMSFTSDIANELLFRYPNKIILIARNKSGQMKCSMRAANYNLPPLIEKSMVGLDGRGGGHEHAAGVVVNVDDFEQFMKNMKEEVKKIKK